jgi:tRNA (mo5U34)-methyltransferase
MSESAIDVVRNEADTAGANAREAIASIPLWYHTMELAPGVQTPGWFDLRPVVDRMPWPDVQGKRCLDIGPWDGFLSFELERRGAAEVVAADIGDPAGWDWPAYRRDERVAAMAAISGERTGLGFDLARRLLGSKAQRVEVSVYDLSSRTVGEFDVVVMGSLLLHVKDPVRALEAVHSVCGEYLLSAEQIALDLTVLHRRRPLARSMGGENCQWWVPNSEGHRTLVRAAGFEIERTTRPYAIPYGRGHPGGTRMRRRLLTRLAAGGDGVAHAAVLARPKR